MTLLTYQAAHCSVWVHHAAPPTHMLPQHLAGPLQNGPNSLQRCTHSDIEAYRRPVDTVLVCDGVLNS